MPSGIAAFIRAEIDARGMTQAAFAERAGIRKSSLSYILNTPNMRPRIGTLERIAQALDVPITRLIEVAGIPVPPRRHDAGDDAETEQVGTRLTAMVESVPELAGLLDHLTQLPQEDIQAVARYVEWYVQDQTNRHSRRRREV